MNFFWARLLGCFAILLGYYWLLKNVRLPTAFGTTVMAYIVPVAITAGILWTSFGRRDGPKAHVWLLRCAYSVALPLAALLFLVLFMCFMKQECF